MVNDHSEKSEAMPPEASVRLSVNGYDAFVPDADGDEGGFEVHIADPEVHRGECDDDCSCGHHGDPDHECTCHEKGFHEPDFEESVFGCAGVSYHVRRWGDPRDIPIILLHGFMQSGDGWWVVAPSLAQDHCVYALDLVGHGLSDRPEEAESYTVSSAAAAVAAFIERVVPADTAAARECPVEQVGKRRAHIIGYSMGGRIAIEVAAFHPDAVYSLILENAGLGPADDDERAAFAARAAAWARDLREKGIEEFVDRWEDLELFATQKRLSPGLREAIRAERLANDPEAIARAAEGMGQHTMRSADENIAMLCATWLPICYLCGTRDERHLEVGRRFLNEGFEAKPIMAGHNTHVEDPAGFIDAVISFLDSVEVKKA